MAPQQLEQLQQKLARTLKARHQQSHSSRQGNPQPAQQQPAQQSAEANGSFEPNQQLEDLVDSFGRTALHHAAKDGKDAAVQRLIVAGADVNKRDKQGGTPLLWAAQQGHTEVVRALLEAGASASIPDKALWVPLHWAAQNGHDEVVELLLDAGAEIELPDSHGVRPLHLAAQSGHERVVELLLADRRGIVVDAVADPDSFTPLYMAARRGHANIVALLLAAGADLAASVGQGFTALHAAAEQGHCEVVKLLLRAGAPARSPTQHGSTPLHLAAWNGHSGTAQIIMDAHGGGAGAALARDGQGWTPLYLAARRGHEHLVQALLDCSRALVDEDCLVRTAKASAATGHMSVFAMLAKEIGREYPSAVPTLLMSPDAVSSAAALSAMVSKCLSDSADNDTQRAALRREREQVAIEKTGAQHLIVQAAGMLKKARLARCQCGHHCDDHMQH